MENSKNHNKYLGKWIFLPELCFYEEGDCPQFGVYEIAQRAGNVHLSISWETRDGIAHQIEFNAPDNGIKTSVKKQVSRIFISRESTITFWIAAHFLRKRK